MRGERLQDRIRASEERVEDILRTPTPPPAATATLVDLLTALDARRLCRETMVLGETTTRRRADRGA